MDTKIDPERFAEALIASTSWRNPNSVGLGGLNINAALTTYAKAIVAAEEYNAKIDELEQKKLSDGLDIVNDTNF